jgi:hypothetical protein
MENEASVADTKAMTISESIIKYTTALSFAYVILMPMLFLFGA